MVVSLDLLPDLPEIDYCYEFGHRKAYTCPFRRFVKEAKATIYNYILVKIHSPGICNNRFVHFLPFQHHNHHTQRLPHHEQFHLHTFQTQASLTATHYFGGGSSATPQHHIHQLNQHDDLHATAYLAHSRSYVTKPGPHPLSSIIIISATINREAQVPHRSASQEAHVPHLEAVSYLPVCIA